MATALVEAGTGPHARLRPLLVEAVRLQGGFWAGARRPTGASAYPPPAGSSRQPATSTTRAWPRTSTGVGGGIVVEAVGLGLDMAAWEGRPRAPLGMTAPPRRAVHLTAVPHRGGPTVHRGRASVDPHITRD